MMHPSTNPFPDDPDRHAIWEILMRRDFEAFAAADWSLTENDFAPDLFVGYDAGGAPNPDQWRVRYPGIEPYREEWLRQAEEFQGTRLAGGESVVDFLFRVIELREIEINGSEAVAHKKFNGATKTESGEPVALNWQTLYFMHKRGSEWKIRGFLGYLPYSMPS